MDKLKYLEELKAKNNAIILAHYYQDPDIQDIADYMGDSLALAQFAQKTNADVILFCGVHFMSETAKILNPDKTVLIPDLDAGCSLADSASTKEFKEWVESHKNSTVVSYINCSAEVKAMSDIICTSSNAEKIINSIPKETKILFAPDKYLGQYLIKKTGRDLTLWNGYCQVHAIFSLKDLIKLEMVFFNKDETDTRIKHIFLNEKGKKIFNEIFEIQKKRIYNALLNSSSQEVLNFDEVLKRIINE